MAAVNVAPVGSEGGHFVDSCSRCELDGVRLNGCSDRAEPGCRFGELQDRVLFGSPFDELIERARHLPLTSSEDRDAVTALLGLLSDQRHRLDEIAQGMRVSEEQRAAALNDLAAAHTVISQVHLMVASGYETIGSSSLEMLRRLVAGTPVEVAASA